MSRPAPISGFRRNPHLKEGGVSRPAPISGFRRNPRLKEGGVSRPAPIHAGSGGTRTQREGGVSRPAPIMRVPAEPAPNRRAA